MRTIYKYRLGPAFDTDILMPPGAKILSAKMQGSALCIWAEVVRPLGSKEKRTIRIVGTGTEIEADANLAFIDTVIDGAFVWHVYEVLPFAH